MNINLLYTITLIPSILFIITSITSVFKQKNNLFLVKKMSLIAAILGVGTSIACFFILINKEVIESPFIGINNIGFSFRYDTLSVIMLSMISILSFIVIRFSHNYLDGDDKQNIFIGRLSATIASVQLLVISGNLGVLFISWVLTSVFLQRLLLFYKDRPRAKIAATKKFIVARVGDLSLLIAFYLLYIRFDSGNLEIIFQSIQSKGSIGGIEDIAILIGIAAILKSAQFPLHGWLIEVMETPTPVSALLHAGLLNAGPFLVIRMANIIELSEYTSIFLIVIGSLTAVFASIVYLTQTSIKTALGYSSIAHMGFSLFVCGLGLYPAALLHLVAHSFYKAHAFLSSGSAIEVVQTSKLNSNQRIGNPLRIFAGIILGFSTYALFAWMWGVNVNENIYLFILGGIIALGLSRIFTSSLDSNGSVYSFIQLGILATIITNSFFVFENLFHSALKPLVPNQLPPSFAEYTIVGVITLIYISVVFIQIFSPNIKQHVFTQKMAIHFKNGLYLNVLFDRLVRSINVNEINEESSIKDKPVLVTNETYSKQKLKEIYS